MTGATSDLPAPGWYPDPYGIARLRWWDGSNWTENLHPASPADVQPRPLLEGDNETGKLILFHQGAVPGGRGPRPSVRNVLLRSVRWAGVFLRPIHVVVDAEPALDLTAVLPRTIPLSIGTHRITAWNKTFPRIERLVNVEGDREVICAFSCGPGFDSLKIEAGDDPALLYPYRSYKQMPLRHDGVLESVTAGFLASLGFLALGLLPLIALMVFLARRDLGTIVVMAPLAVSLSIVMVPIGIVGLLTTFRFVRLPAGWRTPQNRDSLDRYQRPFSRYLAVHLVVLTCSVTMAVVILGSKPQSLHKVFVPFAWLFLSLALIEVIGLVRAMFRRLRHQSA